MQSMESGAVAVLAIFISGDQWVGEDPSQGWPSKLPFTHPSLLYSLLRDRGLSRNNVNSIFHGLVLSRVQYTLSQRDGGISHH